MSHQMISLLCLFLWLRFCLTFLTILSDGFLFLRLLLVIFVMLYSFNILLLQLFLGIFLSFVSFRFLRRYSSAGTLTLAPTSALAFSLRLRLSNLELWLRFWLHFYLSNWFLIFFHSFDLSDISGELFRDNWGFTFLQWQVISIILALITLELFSLSFLALWNLLGAYLRLRRGLELKNFSFKLR